MYPIIESTIINFHGKQVYRNIVLDKTGNTMMSLGGMYWRVHQNKKGEWTVTAKNPLSGKYL